MYLPLFHLREQRVKVRETYFTRYCENSEANEYGIF